MHFKITHLVKGNISEVIASLESLSSSKFHSDFSSYLTGKLGFQTLGRPLLKSPGGSFPLVSFEVVDQGLWLMSSVVRVKQKAEGTAGFCTE